MSQVLGFGGGGGGGGGGKETPDNLISTAYARVLDLISEGEIDGLVDGMRSIYLNETPLQNADNSFNFNGVRAEWREGTQGQSHIAGFPSAEVETGVEVKVTATAPWTRTVQNRSLSAVVVRLATGAMYEQTSDGDMVGTKVEYVIELSTNGGPYTAVVTASFAGKTTSRYERSHRINLPATQSNWNLRVRRLTPDSTSSKLQNEFSVSAITEVLDAKLRYPNSALVGIQFDAAAFSGSLPSRAYHARGLIIQVPSNYDPETRTYSGTWNGSFKRTYSDNPAWVFYDLCTNPRYGCGSRIPASYVDRWSLYAIGQYCDQMVPNGRGGLEPRFSCFIYQQSRRAAWDLIQDFASIFRGMAYYAAGTVVPVADMPKLPKQLVTQANVLDGLFHYTGSPHETRYSTALVSWIDPANFYRPAVEYVEDRAALLRYGHRATEFTAFGCKSQGQAQRAGRWALLTSTYETDTVSFRMALDAIAFQPGDVIAVADANRARQRLGGRILASTSTSVTLDVPPDQASPVNVGDTISMMTTAGTLVSRKVLAKRGAYVTFDGAPLGTLPQVEGAWVIEGETKTQLFRVLSVKESGPMEFEIQGVEYVEGKFDGVEYGVRIEERPIVANPASVQAAPTNVRWSTRQVVHQGINRTIARLDWDAAPGAAYYEGQWRRNDGEWVSFGRTGSLGVEIDPAYAGSYLARVYAFNIMDRKSLPAVSALAQLTGKVSAPPSVSYLSLAGLAYAIMIRWGFPAQGASDLLETEIWASSTSDPAYRTLLARIAYPTSAFFFSGVPPGVVYYFWARTVDRSGNAGPFYPTGAGERGEADTDANLYLEAIRDEVVGTELGQQLLGDITHLNATVGTINTDIQQIGGRIQGLDVNVGNLADDVRGLGFNVLNLIAEAGVNDGVIREVAEHAQKIAEDLTAEAKERAKGVAEAVQRVLDEAGARTAEAAVITQRILDEAAARAALAAAISQDLQDEVNARIAQAAAQTQALQNESAARAAAVQGVANDLSAEAAARADALTAISADYTDLVNTASNSLTSRIDSLTSEVASILGAEEYNSASSYATGNLVSYQGKLYRAKQASTNKVPTNTSYWEKIGNYDSIGAAVSDLASRVTTVESATASHASRLSTVESRSATATSNITSLQQTVAGQTTRLDQQQTTIGTHTSQISGLQTTTASHTSQLSTLSTSVGGNTTKITNLQTTDATRAQQVSQLQTTTGSLTTRVQSVETATSELASRASSLEASSGEAVSRIEQLETAKDGLVTRTGALEVASGQASARLATLDEVSVEHSLALMNLKASVGDSDGEITEILKVSADHAQRLVELGVADEKSASRIRVLEDVQAAEASRLTELQTKTGTLETRVATTETTSAGLASRVSTVEAKADANSSAITAVQTVNATQATQISGLTTRVGGTESAITAVQQTAEGAASRLATVEVTTNSHASRIAAVETVNASQATQLSNLTTRAGENESAIASERTTRANADTALGTRIDTLTTRVGSAESAITAETSARVTKDTALTNQLNALTGRVGTAEGAITQEQAARVSADNALTSSVNALTTKVGDNESAIATEATARASRDTALTNLITALTTRVGTAETRITSETSTRTSADSALGTRIDTLTTQVGSAETAITSETSARTAADSALGSRVDTLTTKVNNNASAITSESTTRANADSALSTRIDAVLAKADGNAASITTEVNARASADEALASRLSVIEVGGGNLGTRLTSLEEASLDQALTLLNLQATVGDTDGEITEIREVSATQARVIETLGVKAGAAASKVITLDEVTADHATRIGIVESGTAANSAAISSEATTRANADSAMATQISGLTSRMGTNESAISSEATTRAGADSALSSRIDTLVTRTGTAEAAIHTEAATRANADSALTSRLDTLTTRVGETESSIQTEATTRANANSTLTNQVTSAVSRIGTAEAAIALESSTRATLEGKLSAMTTLKSQVTSGGKKYYAGIGLGVENAPNGSGFQSQILFQADRIGVLNTANGNVTMPFVIQGGQVFMNQALIGSAWIKDGNIENLNGDKIWTDSLHANRIITSTFAAELTKINTAYIKSAHIGNAQVDTLRIAGNAVTVPISASGVFDANGVTVVIPAGNAGTVVVLATIDSYDDNDRTRRMQVVSNGTVRFQRAIPYTPRSWEANNDQMGPFVVMHSFNINNNENVITVRRSSGSRTPSMQLLALTAKR